MNDPLARASSSGGARAFFFASRFVAHARVFALAAVWVGGSASCEQAPKASDNDAAIPAPSTWWVGDGPHVIACKTHDTVAAVEERILLPKCGAAGDNTCHATGPNPPRIAEVGKIAQNLVEMTPMLRCWQDKLVSRDDPANSDVLFKIRARNTSARCSNGTDGGPGMPYQDAPQLTADEAACLEWWVHEIVK
ncbi:MAG: hypothetical protein H7X95_07080 [Deltaproteobacteria bacterium]|nr:hypothetical protein [Deltaproteobacteria bacterium]